MEVAAINCHRRVNGTLESGGSNGFNRFRFNQLLLIIMTGAGLDTLTPREREILVLLAQGCLYKEIAGQLGISPSTVRAHLHTIYGKLAVKSRTQAVVRFLQG
jgi:DNA-binding CsgD family transcriptional regulator